jgi:hypothetical protein
MSRRRGQVRVAGPVVGQSLRSLRELRGPGAVPAGQRAVDEQDRSVGFHRAGLLEDGKPEMFLKVSDVSASAGFVSAAWHDSPHHCSPRSLFSCALRIGESGARRIVPRGRGHCPDRTAGSRPAQGLQGVPDAGRDLQVEQDVRGAEVSPETSRIRLRMQRRMR